MTASLRRFPLLIALVLCPMAQFAQHTAARFEAACIGFYNVENLYDTLDAPDVDDAEFLPGGAKRWDGARYRRKLERLAHVIGDMGRDIHPRGMAILGLAEVENRAVLEDLVATPPIASRGYRIVHEDGPDRRGVDVALLYDPAVYMVLAHKSYALRLPDRPDFRTRDQLLVSGLLDGDTVHVIVAHWPSRRGGEKRSMPNRKAAAELGRHIMDSLFARDAQARIIYMGDLNDDPVDPSVQRFLRSTGDKEKAVDGRLYNPMYAPYRKGIGTLAWRDAWNLFDQVLISPALVTGAGGGYRYYGVRIFNGAYLRNKEGAWKDYPFRTYVGDTWTDGYSDHFPVYLILVKDAPATRGAE